MKNKKVLAMALAVGVLASPFASSHAAEDAGFEIFANEGEGATFVGEENNKPVEKIEELDGEAQNGEGFVDSEYTKKEEAETIKDLTEDDDAVEVEKEKEEVVSGYATRQEAEDAAKEALKNDPINGTYTVSQGADGRWHYVLAPAATDGTDGEEDHSDDQGDEQSTEKGYDTKEDAENAAKKALKDDKINKSYSVSQGADGKWYYVLSPVEAEEKDDSKDKEGTTEKTVNGETTKVNVGTAKTVATANKPVGATRTSTVNPKTGIASIASVAGVLAAASVAYKENRKRD